MEIWVEVSFVSCENPTAPYEAEVFILKYYIFDIYISK